MIYLSICIPTYQRIEITRNTIASIYADLEEVDMTEFEVIVSDNDAGQSSICFKKEFPYENFHYYQTKCEGFLNSFHVLSYGQGVFLKLHNNYTQLKKGTLKYLINEIKSYIGIKPTMYFTNGLLEFNRKKEYTNFNEYMYDLSYFSSWSTGFGIWKDDFLRIVDNVQVDKMFPQTSLFISCREKNKYVLNDNILFLDQKVPRKGGYNPYKVFGIDYLNILNSLCMDGSLEKRVFDKIKTDLLNGYLASRFFKTVIAKMDKFDSADIKKHLSVYYSDIDYYRMIIYSWFSPIGFIIRKLKNGWLVTRLFSDFL